MKLDELLPDDTVKDVSSVWNWYGIGVKSITTDDSPLYRK
jgi:hypothetical protein